jgi:putative flippase GtrA
MRRRNGSPTTSSFSAKSGNRVRPEPGSGARRGEILRFLLAGGLNTGFTWGIYLVAALFVGYQLAYAICFACGILFSYVVSLRYVFRRPGSWGKLLRYPLVYAVQYGVGALLLELLVRGGLVPAWLAPLIVVVATLPLTFVLSRYVLSAGAGRPP